MAGRAAKRIWSTFMVHLFLKTYRDALPERNAEMAEAVRRNKACRFFDHVVEISEPADMSIREMMAIARSRVGWADVTVIANGDIYFDQTAVLMNHVGYSECFALSRYEDEQGEQLCENPQGSQSAWVFRGPPPDVAADFAPYQPGCEHRLNWLLREAGYAIYNPSLSIKSHHLHASGVRYIDAVRDKLPGEGLLVPPCRIERIRHRPSDRILKPGRVAIIQLARLGDIVNALPIAFDLYRQGHRVSWYVCREFAPLLEGVSYVTPVIWDGPEDKPAEAIDDAKARGFDHILAIQCNGNPEPSPRKLRSFSTETWARGGYLDKYHILPCVFDRAQAPIGTWRPAGERPILAYCFDAKTWPYAQDLKRDMIQWLQENFGGDFALYPIGPSIGRPDALAIVLRQAKVLISLDSFPLHMGYAAGTPTIAITTARGWNASEPRRNWIERIDYVESVMPAGRAKIAAALRAVIAGKIEPGRCIAQPENMPAEPASQLRVLSILIATLEREQPALRALLDGLVLQLSGHQEIEVTVDTDNGQTPLWQKRNKLLQGANGEYCCFIDVGDNVGENFIAWIGQALRDRPDCVGFKMGHFAGGKLQRVETFSIEAEGGGGGISHLCPVRTEIARKIGFGPGGDAEYAEKLAASGLLESENFIDAVIYAKPADK
jgi:hypothetical protein